MNYFRMNAHEWKKEPSWNGQTTRKLCRVLRVQWVKMKRKNMLKKESVGMRGEQEENMSD